MAVLRRVCGSPATTPLGFSPMPAALRSVRAISASPRARSPGRRRPAAAGGRAGHALGRVIDDLQRLARLGVRAGVGVGGRRELGLEAVDAKDHGSRAARSRPVQAAAVRHDARGMARIYVTGHRNPDTDSIASAIGYAELKRRIDPGNDYVAGAPGRAQRADALGARAQRRAGADVHAAHHAARARRDAGVLPDRQPRRAGPRGRPDDGPRGPRSDPDRGRRRDAGGRHDRARARPPLRARVTRGLEPGRRRRARQRDRHRPGGRAARRRGQGGGRPRLGLRHGRRPAAEQDRRGRRRRRRATGPTPSATRSTSARGCWSRATPRGRPTRCSRWPRSAKRPSSCRRWTAT